MSKTVFLKVSSAFLVDGQIAKVGEVVEVNKTEAKDLLHRGKAMLAVLDPADQLDDSIDADANEQAHDHADEHLASEEQPAAPAPTKGKGKKAK